MWRVFDRVIGIGDTWKILTIEFNSKKVRNRSVVISDNEDRHRNISLKKIREIGWIEQADGLFLIFIKFFKYKDSFNLNNYRSPRR